MGLDPKPYPRTFFQQDDVVALARQLIGQLLISEKEGKRCVARITETEAYRGWGDRACHAHLGRKTQRTQIMYQPGGLAYVYLCYGIHNLFNIVSNRKGQADAILLRAAEPLEGTEHMLKRRKMEKVSPRLSSGPGNLSQALGIERSDYGLDLSKPPLYLAPNLQASFTPKIQSSPRVGIDYAGEDAALPWRFYDPRSRFVTKG